MDHYKSSSLTRVLKTIWWYRVGHLESSDIILKAVEPNLAHKLSIHNQRNLDILNIDTAHFFNTNFPFNTSKKFHITQNLPYIINSVQ